MKTNKLVISINKPLYEVFAFTITPPNSTYWIPGIIKEETNELPIRKGTIYKLHTSSKDFLEVTVTDFKQNKKVEWRSTDYKYHCRYTYIPIDENTCKIEYLEWVDKGQLDEPFTKKILQKLKLVIETL
jgi:hypothetical protein